MTGADGVRSTAKGILVHESMVLLNRCRDQYNGDYFCLPGGGQEKYETLAETLRREMLEETGYRVTNLRFAGLFEEICDDEGYRREYPQYSHKMYHFFVCAPESLERAEVTEMDDSQLACEWFPIETLDGLNIHPRALGAHLREMIECKTPLFLGSEHAPLPHG
ncbi:MAG: NUDIX domain-containing protein [Clostridia bacterium]|nr:NUDIX domain-containing protein [Clostridia bacterium]